jgi:hypothetical protein
VSIAVGLGGGEPVKWIGAVVARRFSAQEPSMPLRFDGFVHPRSAWWRRDLRRKTVKQPPFAGA